jgi:hypothetical protein
MFFINHGKDNPLLQELIREGVFNSATWESLTMPPEGYLMDVLVNNRAKILERPWLDWLIRKHGCTRVAGMEPTPAFVKALDRQLLSECLKMDCYPLLCGENHLYVGIGRPDCPELVSKLLNFYKKKILYNNALTINEVYRMRELGRKALQTL